MQEVVGSSPAPVHSFLVALKESYIGSIEYEDSLRALKTAAFQTTSSYAMEKSSLLHFTISSL